MTALGQSAAMTGRRLRGLLRQPWYIAASLGQPIVWLLLFGQLFKRVVQIPGFGDGSYITFLIPGVVMMNALFAGNWAGMTLIEEIDAGVLDHFLVSPLRPAALLAGELGYHSLVVAVQSLLMIALGMLVGAHLAGGAPGLLVLVLAAALLATGVAALSNALALVLRRGESLIAASQFVALPMTFLATAFMPASLAPGWIRTVERFNPFNWAVLAGRESLTADPAWGAAAGHLGALLALLLLAVFLSLRAFRGYRRSL